MNQFRNFKIALSFASALTLFAASARADTWDKKTTVRFSQAVEVPGAVLQPGTYVMKLVDLSTQRHVVQFMNERENQVYAAAMAIPTYRDRVTDYTVIGFYEAPAGQPEAMKNWYYPGDNYGQEFLYPKGRGGAHLAAFTPPPAADASLNTRNETNVTPTSTPEVANPAPLQTGVDNPPAPASQPVEIAQAAQPRQESEEPVTLAQNQPATPPALNSAPADTALPKTASNLPEVAGLGLLSLAGAAMVRKFRKPVS
jgi:hypothetical protein